MKKRVFKILIGLAAVAAFAYYCVCEYSVNFMYVNPYTQTSVFKDISKVVKSYEKSLDGAKRLAAFAGYNFDYKYVNGYGSGFLMHNPIPNDLDTEVFVDLGTFDYDKEKDKYAIADQIVTKMDAFQYYLVKYIESTGKNEFYTIKTTYGMRGLLDSRHDKYVQEVAGSIDEVIANKKYINHITKIARQDGHIIYYKPYVMDPGRAILKDYELVNLFSDMVSYYDYMPKYMRILSLEISFCAKIKHNGKYVNVEFVPELYSTGPLAIEYRLYAPNIFFKNSSKDYIKDLYSFEDEDSYIKWLLYCYADHLKVIYSEDAFEHNPMKIFKRTLQLTDIIRPVLGEKESQEIYNYIGANLKNRDINLLNEYVNIVDLMGRIFRTGKMYTSLKNEGKINVMTSTLESVLNELKTRGNVHPEDLKVLEDYYNTDIKSQLDVSLSNDVIKNQKENLDLRYQGEIIPLVSKIVLYTIPEPAKMHAIINRLKNIYFDAGFHYVYLYVADRNTFYVEKDEYTKSVKDFKELAQQNDLAWDMEFKVLPKEQIPSDLLKYRVWVRYNATKAQDEYYQHIKDVLIKNQNQFKINQKRYFVK